MDRFFENIDKQLAFNQDKNILLENLELFQFAIETVTAVSNIDRINPHSKQRLIAYATDKSIEEFCRVNQYYSFDTKAKNDLKKIYSDLFDNLQLKKDSIENISGKHYKNLRSWLKQSNPFADKIYLNADRKIIPVACSEYSALLQINILHIEVMQLLEPVLDIGCGSGGSLVNHLKKLGIEIYGLDRHKFSTSDMITADWLEYDYGKEKWGTIISNLGFSNHFNHHNMRENGNYLGYGRAYMNILQALKIGGSFHYAPDLPFIEKYLDIKHYEMRNYKIHAYNFKTSVVKRLK